MNVPLHRISWIALMACAPAVLAWTCWGPLAGLAGLSLGAFAVLFGSFNTMPWLYRPRPSYEETDRRAIHWPEALPLESFRGNDRLLFCVHGFPSTPADFRKVEGLSNEAGWDLFAPLLPGCGTSPAELVRGGGWDQYLAYIEDRWMELRPRYRVACLVGSSMGGSLCLALAERLAGRGELEPDALATIGSPAVLNAFIRHGIVKNPLIYAARTLGALVPMIGARYPEEPREGEDGDDDWKGYLGIYPRLTYTMQTGLRAMDRRLKDVRCPTLICHATGDRIVPFENAALIARGLGSSRIELYAANMDGYGHARHNLILYDSQRDAVWRRVLSFFADNIQR